MGSMAAGEDGDLLIKWLAPMVLLVSNFKAHSSVHRFYCTTCHSAFFRKKTTSTNDSIVICPNSSPNHHQLHKVLRVYLASHAFCIRREDIKAVWNPSDICVYVINKRDIYFIQQKTKSPNFLLLGNGNHHPGHCRICGYKLMQPHTSFCSIQCKITDLNTLLTNQQRITIQTLEIRKADRPAAHDDEREDEEEDLPSSVNIATTFQLYQSLRKRPRKSLHPQRSPLF